MVRPTLQGLAATGRTLGVVALLSAASCASEPDPIPGVDESEYGGLTPEQIEMQASPMSLEEAESLGIVDSTIRIEIPIGSDTLLPIPADTGG